MRLPYAYVRACVCSSLPIRENVHTRVLPYAKEAKECSSPPPLFTLSSSMRIKRAATEILLYSRRFMQTLCILCSRCAHGRPRETIPFVARLFYSSRTILLHIFYIFRTKFRQFTFDDLRLKRRGSAGAEERTSRFPINTFSRAHSFFHA